jgi:hypothetical protein
MYLHTRSLSLLRGCEVELGFGQSAASAASGSSGHAGSMQLCLLRASQVFACSLDCNIGLPSYIPGAKRNTCMDTLALSPTGSEQQESTYL